MKIRVSVIEDDPVLRDCLSVVINGVPGLQCLGLYPDAESAVEHLPGEAPDVVLLDIHLPGMNGIECLKRLKPRVADTLFIMLTAYSDDQLVFEALSAGAVGYLLKRTPSAEIVAAVEDAMRGGSPMTGQIARRVVQSFRSRPAHAADDTPQPALSAREHEILALLSKGFRYKEIAAQLSISTETVRTHLRRIYEKLQVRSRTEAVVRYLNKES